MTGRLIVENIARGRFGGIKGVFAGSFAPSFPQFTQASMEVSGEPD